MNRREARKRAADLAAKMTLEEKVSQLRYDAPAIPHLNVPAYNWWNESLHGVARAGTATVFPQSIGIAASFDEELAEKIGEAIALEGRAKYNAASALEDRTIYKGLTFWAPNVNIFRDPRWGRGHETYGEDPVLSARLGTAYIRGLQGDGEYLKAAACAKHFAVHSGPEELRHEFDAEVSKKDLEETYLPAFRACVQEAHVEAVMGAYNRVNGEPCCGSPTLLRDTLRGDWGFEGHVVSDCWAIADFHENHMVTKTPAESAALALQSGCDLNCGVTYLHLLNAYKKGLVSEEQITESVIRLFTTRYLLGLFDGSEYDSIPYETVESPEHLRLSERAATESAVLLKNNGILPLNKDHLTTIGVIGPNANSRECLIGNYYGTASEYVTVLDGIRRHVGDSARILYSEGCALCKSQSESERYSEARTVARCSDVVILCLGLDATLEGEQGDTGNSFASGDKRDLLLPESQRGLMEAVAKENKPVILCLLAGSDLDLSYAMEHFDAILMLWYPGAQGGKAAADLLFGEISPSGKLPVTFYESIEQLPDFENYAMEGRTYRYFSGQVQYPFGYGLTYADTEMISMELSEEDDTPVLHVRARNLSQTASDDVIQVYIRALNSPWETPHAHLAAFRHVSFAAGEEICVSIPLRRDCFTVVDSDGIRRFEDTYEIFAGFSQPDARSAELTGKKPLRMEYKAGACLNS